MDKLFLLFEKGIKDNIIIIFTFVDDFDNVQNLTAFKTLNNENSPFINILGPIENLPHFEFKNLAYLTNNVKQFSYVFDKCQTNFDKLLKYASNLKPISLKETVKVLEDRYIIINFIKNVCDDIQKIAILMENRDQRENLKKRLEEFERCSTITVEKKVRQTIPIEEKYIDDDNIVRTRIFYIERYVEAPENKEVEEKKKDKGKKSIKSF